MPTQIYSYDIFLSQVTLAIATTFRKLYLCIVVQDS